MGYYVAILRADDSFSAQENPIGRDEWLDCAKRDPEMRILPAGPMPLPGMPNFRIQEEGDEVWWPGYPDANPDGVVWFTYQKEGYIEVKNPDERILRKMFEIARQLSAKVQGEEGELYGPNGELIVNPAEGSSSQ